MFAYTANLLGYIMKRILSLVYTIAIFNSSILAESYLNHLKPDVHIQFNEQKSVYADLVHGMELKRSPNYPGEASWVAGPHKWTGGALDFEGVPGGYILDIKRDLQPVFGDFQKSDGFTVSFWFKGEFQGKSGRLMSGIFDIGNSKAGIWGGSNDYNTTSISRRKDVWNNKWHHACFVIDYRAEKNNVSFYMDGKFESAKTVSYLRGMFSRQWAIGARNLNAGGAECAAFADFAFWNRPLKYPEIGYINNGPVYAGPDTEHTLPNKFNFQGTSSHHGVWKQLSGPQTVKISDLKNIQSSVIFKDAGDYEFAYVAKEGQSKIKIKVLPNQAPYVNSGAAKTILVGEKLQLMGQAHDDSIAPNKKLQVRWKVLEKPEGAKISCSNSKALNPNISFNTAGLYTLALEATDGELISSQKLSVLVKTKTKEETHYLSLLDPMILLGLDKTPQVGEVARKVDIGNTGYYSRFAKNGLPLLSKGAREFTGYAHDFSETDSDYVILNRATVIHAWDYDWPGRSVSFWVKAKPEQSGHLHQSLGTWRLHKHGGIQIWGNHGGMPDFKVSKEEYNVQDGEWHNVVLTLTSNKESLHTKMYIDGKFIKEKSDPRPEPWFSLRSLYVQHVMNLASRGRSGADNFNGKIDDFAIYDYSLTPEQVNYIFNGPQEDDKELLAKQDELFFDLGEDQTLAHKSNKVFTVKPQIKGLSKYELEWSKLRGAGDFEVDRVGDEFKIKFKAIDDDADLKYSKIVLMAKLKTPNGKLLARDNIRLLINPEEAPQTRKFTQLPKAGVHPRLLCTIKDLPELRRKVREVELCKAAFEAVKARVVKLDDINNPKGALYKKILAGEEFTTEYMSNLKNCVPDIYTDLWEAAYVNWIGVDNVSNESKLKELAEVCSKVAEEQLTWYVPTYKNALSHDISQYLPFAYDFLQAYMSEEQAKPVRALLSRSISFRQTMRFAGRAEMSATNWSGHHDHPVFSAAAIEGEEGEDKDFLSLTEWENGVFETQYGIFPSGAPHEGYAYYSFGLHWQSIADLIVARRPPYENLFESGRFYKNVEFAFKLMDPSAGVMRTHHDIIPPTHGGGAALDILQPHLLVAKYVWPNDPKVDYVYRELSKNYIKTKSHSLRVFDAMFGEAVSYPNQTYADAAKGLPLNMFCPDRGFMLARSSWSDESLRLHFRCRMDKYWLGHVHSDVNSFEFWSHNREWFIDLGKKSHTQNDARQTILIDGIGANSSKRPAWPSMPGKFISFEDDKQAVIGTGDAKPFYDYTFGQGPYKEVDTELTWADFHYDRPGMKMPEWKKWSKLTLNGYGHVGKLRVMNPVEKAFRTVAMVKGRYPYLIVADDYQKDSQVRNYTWLATMPTNGTMELVEKGKDFLIMKHKKDDENGPRLLVKLMSVEGSNVELDFREDPLVLQDKTQIPISQVQIRVKSKAPQYRIMLYPHMPGDDLPQITANSHSAQVRIGSTLKNVNFTSGDKGVKISFNKSKKNILQVKK